MDIARKKIIKDLETVYRAALDAGNYASAIKALELQGKELGLFNEKNKIQVQREITELRTEELEALLKFAPEEKT